MSRSVFIRIFWVILIVVVLLSCGWLYAAYRFKAHVAELLAEHIDVPIDLTIEGYPFAFAVRASLTQEEQNAVYALIDKQLDGFDLNDTLADQTKDWLQSWQEDADVDVVLGRNIVGSSMFLEVASATKSAKLMAHMSGKPTSWQHLNDVSLQYSHDGLLVSAQLDQQDNGHDMGNPLLFHLNANVDEYRFAADVQTTFLLYTADQVVKVPSLEAKLGLKQQPLISKPVFHQSFYYDNPHSFTQQDNATEQFLQEYNQAVRRDSKQLLRYALLNLLPMEGVVSLESHQVGFDLTTFDWIPGDVFIRQLSLETTDVNPARIHWLVNAAAGANVHFDNGSWSMVIHDQLRVNDAAERFMEDVVAALVESYVTIPGTDALINPKMMAQLHNYYQSEPDVSLLQSHVWSIKQLNPKGVSQVSLLIENVGQRSGAVSVDHPTLAQNKLKITADDIRFNQSIGQTRLYATSNWSKRLATSLADAYFLSTPVLNNIKPLNDDELLVNKREVYSMVNELEDLQLQANLTFDAYDWQARHLKNLNFDMAIQSYPLNVNTYINGLDFSFIHPKAFDWVFEFKFPSGSVGDIFDHAKILMDYVYDIRKLRQRDVSMRVGFSLDSGVPVIKRPVKIDPARLLSHDFKRTNSLARSLVPLVLIWNFQPV